MQNKSIFSLKENVGRSPGAKNPRIRTESLLLSKGKTDPDAALCVDLWGPESAAQKNGSGELTKLYNPE